MRYILIIILLTGCSKDYLQLCLTKMQPTHEPLAMIGCHVCYDPKMKDLVGDPSKECEELKKGL
jgi:hypothetical protein